MSIYSGEHGCSRFACLYSLRHRLVNKFGEELSGDWEFTGVNQQFSTSLPEIPLTDELKCLKPDILLKKENNISYLYIISCGIG